MKQGLIIENIEKNTAIKTNDAITAEWAFIWVTMVAELILRTARAALHSKRVIMRLEKKPREIL